MKWPTNVYLFGILIKAIPFPYSLRTSTEVAPPIYEIDPNKTIILANQFQLIDNIIKNYNIVKIINL